MSRDTRQIIITALLRLAQRHPEKTQFTVTEIASEARISRQAIYQKHYRNVDDIIQDIHLQIATEARQKITNYPPQSGKSPFLIIADEMIPVLYRYREWLRVIYTSSLYPGWLKYLEQSYRPWLTPFIVENCPNLEVDLEIVLQLIIGHVLNLFVAWLKQPIPLPPDTFREKFLDFILLSPNDYLSNQYRLKSE